jgi:hypothetical protein
MVVKKYAGTGLFAKEKEENLKFLIPGLVSEL